MNSKRYCAGTSAVFFTLLFLFSTHCSAGAAALAWNTFLGQSSGDRSYGVAVDDSGYAHVAGISNATWGSPVRIYNGASDAFVAKIADNGTLVWNTFLGDFFGDESRKITVDGSGNVYVVGNSSTTWAGPVQPWAGALDAFVAKLDGSGNLLWNTFMGGTEDDYGYGIAVDGSGNVYVAGTSKGTWGTPLRAYTGGSDGFVAKLDSSGNRLWHTFLGGSGTDWGYDLARDGSGRLHVSGFSTGTWGSPVRAYAGDEDTFVVKIADNGTFIWNTFLGGTSYEEGYGIAADSGGNSYVTGYSGGPWSETPVLPYAGGDDAFVAKVDAGGALAWHTFVGTSEYDEGDAIAVDPSGNVFVAGSSGATWGTPAWPHIAGQDAFIARLAPNGALSWNTFFGGSGTDYPYGIALHNNGNVFAAGQSDAAWGDPVRAYSGTDDVFLAKLLLPPATQASDIVFSNVQQEQMDISWTRGNGERCAVFMKQADNGTASPADNATYAADAAFGAGSQIGSTGWYSIYSGTGTGATVTGLTPETIYRVMVCEYNGAAGKELYTIDNTTGNPRNQVTPADNGTDNETCTLKVIPKKLHKLLSLLEPIKGFVLIGEDDTEFVRADKPVWDSEAIKHLFKLKVGKKVVIAIVFVKPLALEPGDVEVTLGECKGTIEVKAL